MTPAPRSSPPGLDSAQVEAMVRRYLARLARRYAPMGVALAALVLVLTLVPSINRSGQHVQATGSGGSGSNTSGGTDGTGNVAAGAGGAGPGAGAAAGGGSASASGVTPAAASGSGGADRSGVTCSAGAKQVAWTVYTPPCVPAYHGNNGGATAAGVNGDTVTAVFRRTNSAEEKAAFAAAGSAQPGTDDQYLSDLRAYIDLFNSSTSSTDATSW